MSDVLIAVPRGNLFQPIYDVLKTAGASLCEKPERSGFLGSGLNGSRFELRYFLRDRRMIPRLVEEGVFAAGFTGLDILIDSGLETSVQTLGRLVGPESYWSLASECGHVHGKGRIGCELLQFAHRVLVPRFEGNLVRIDGFEEYAIRDGLCETVLLVTATGKSVREAGLKLVTGAEKLFTSYPVLIAKRKLSTHQSDAITAFAERICSREGKSPPEPEGMSQADLKQALDAMDPVVRSLHVRHWPGDSSGSSPDSSHRH